MNNKALLFGLVGLILAAGIAGIIYPKVQTVFVDKDGEVKVGAADLNVPYLNINGVTRFYDRINQFAQATTSVCYMPSPKATSTLSATISVNEASTTPLFVELFRVANDQTFATAGGVQIGTTIDIGPFADEGGLGIMNHIVASTTDGGGEGAIFPPNTMALVKIYAKTLDLIDDAGETGKGVSLDGNCNFVWTQF